MSFLAYSIDSSDQTSFAKEIVGSNRSIYEPLVWLGFLKYKLLLLLPRKCQQHLSKMRENYCTMKIMMYNYVLYFLIYVFIFVICICSFNNFVVNSLRILSSKNELFREELFVTLQLSFHSFIKFSLYIYSSAFNSSVHQFIRRRSEWPSTNISEVDLLYRR